MTQVRNQKQNGPAKAGPRVVVNGRYWTRTPPVSCGKDDGFVPTGNKSGNTGTPTGDPARPTPPTDPELAAVVAAWPNLSSAIRAGVLALVKAASGV